jgi:hypothetical protein
MAASYGHSSTPHNREADRGAQSAGDPSHGVVAADGTVGFLRWNGGYALPLFYAFRENIEQKARSSSVEKTTKGVV